MANHLDLARPLFPPPDPPLANCRDSSPPANDDLASCAPSGGSEPSEGPSSRPLILSPPLLTIFKRSQDTIGYNLAALRFIHRQHEAARTAEFYEQDGGMIDEKEVRAKIEAGMKKRKRATLKS
jgi:hypothetical protein